MFEIKITDKDFGLEEKEMVNPFKRFASRGIVRNGDKIAIFFKVNMNEYKLPGGGLDVGESPKDGFKREVKEETGCEIANIKQIGTAEEFKTKSGFYQKSYVFSADVVKDTKILNITEKEKAEGAVLVWLSLDAAIEKIKNSFENLKASPYDKDADIYSSRFVVKRDLKILEEYEKDR